MVPFNRSGIGNPVADNLICAMWSHLRLLMFMLWIGSGSVMAQTSEPGFLLRGYVIGADTGSTIPLANILKRPSGERFISNRYGAFGIKVNAEDTLIFSVIGYHNQVVPVRRLVEENHTDPIRVRMKPATYRLREAEVNWNQHRRDSLARQAAARLKASTLQNDYQHIDSWIKGSSGSPITELLAGGNRKLQEYYKLQHLLELYREQSRVDERYTDALIIRATQIAPSRVLEFRKFCNLPNYFVLNSNDYDLVLAIRACYADFKRNSR